jgi:hypothetical protein
VSSSPARSGAPPAVPRLSCRRRRAARSCRGRRRHRRTRCRRRERRGRTGRRDRCRRRGCCRERRASGFSSSIANNPVVGAGLRDDRQAPVPVSSWVLLSSRKDRLAPSSLRVPNAVPSAQSYGRCGVVGLVVALRPVRRDGRASHHLGVPMMLPGRTARSRDGRGGAQGRVEQRGVRRRHGRAEATRRSPGRACGRRSDQRSSGHAVPPPSVPARRRARRGRRAPARRARRRAGHAAAAPPVGCSSRLLLAAGCGRDPAAPGAGPRCGGDRGGLGRLATGPLDGGTGHRRGSC